MSKLKQNPIFTNNDQTQHNRNIYVPLYTERCNKFSIRSNLCGTLSFCVESSTETKDGGSTYFKNCMHKDLYITLTHSCEQHLKSPIFTNNVQTQHNRNIYTHLYTEIYMHKDQYFNLFLWKYCNNEMKGGERIVLWWGWWRMSFEESEESKLLLIV